MSSDLEGRIDRLEAEAEERTRLAQGVERLSDDVGDLNSILGKVDAQQRQLTELTTRAQTIERTAVTAARHAEENAFTIDERVATVQAERKLFMRKLYRALAGAVAVAVISVVGGAWLTDAHLQNCVLHGPANASQERFCGFTFPGHEHPQELSVDVLLAQGAERQYNAALAARAGCARVQARVRAEIELQNELSRVDPDSAPPRKQAAAALEASLVDCEREYPLPAGDR